MGDGDTGGDEGSCLSKVSRAQFTPRSGTKVNAVQGDCNAGSQDLSADAMLDQLYVGSNNKNDPIVAELGFGNPGEGNASQTDVSGDTSQVGL